MLKLLFPKQAAKTALDARIKARKIQRANHARMLAENPDNWGLIRQRGTL
jgi:hypothetical protein